MSFTNDPGFTVDDAVDDADKTITVPAEESWELLGIYVDLSTTSTVGVRQLEIEINAGGAIAYRALFGETQAESIANKLYAAARNLVSEVHVAGEMIFEQLPLLRLVPGDTIRIFDSATIDVAADDMLVRINHVRQSIW